MRMVADPGGVAVQAILQIRVTTAYQNVALVDHSRAQDDHIQVATGPAREVSGHC